MIIPELLQFARKDIDNSGYTQQHFRESNEIGYINPTWRQEGILWDQGYNLVCGVDEVGRGSIAGPVVAAALIFPAYCNFQISIRDSKMLSRRQREHFFPRIQTLALAYSFGEISAEEVDTIGIVKATHKAMRAAILGLNVKPHYVLVDGREKTSFPKSTEQKAIIKGDQSSYTIAAASILAKVYRDRLMWQYHKKFSQYGFNTHVGYGTKKHFENIAKHGLCKLHRRTFLRKWL